MNPLRLWSHHAILSYACLSWLAHDRCRTVGKTLKMRLTKGLWNLDWEMFD